jgi:Raf kinase inhibitor-like YbhB/YbcL family protein
MINSLISVSTAKILLLAIMAIATTKTLTVKSSAFLNDGLIPAKYTCTGQNISPDMTIDGIPGNAKSLALILDDPDAPKGTFVHWVMWNISVVSKIEENSAPGMQGKNGANENKYTGPCPPSGVHHYHFKVYALDTQLQLPESTDKKALLKVMEGHILASGELIGLYKK